MQNPKHRVFMLETSKNKVLDLMGYEASLETLQFASAKSQKPYFFHQNVPEEL
jgi:hypothetical protein